MQVHDLEYIKTLNAEASLRATAHLNKQRVREAFRDSFLGALPMWQKLLLAEYVEKIPTRKGR